MIKLYNVIKLYNLYCYINKELIIKVIVNQKIRCNYLLEIIL